MLDTVVGHEAQEKRGVLTLNSPIEKGLITNWDDMETIWKHIFRKELKVESSETPVLLTEPSFNPKANRAKTMELMFEAFGTPSAFLASTAGLTALSSGQSTAVMVECGGGYTQAVPVHEYHVLPYAACQLDVTGKELTQYLHKLMTEDNHFRLLPMTSKDVRLLKETLCYVAYDFDKEMQTAASSDTIEKSYEAPDGQVARIGNERFRCPEAYFHPSFLGLESCPIHEMAYNCIFKCDVDIRGSLYKNIVLSGGSSLFPGFYERFDYELQNMASWKGLKIQAHANREYAAWIGGSILGSLTTFADMAVSKDDYYEVGSAIHRKCCM
jgi:actin-related protein